MRVDWLVVVTIGSVGLGACGDDEAAQRGDEDTALSDTSAPDTRAPDGAVTEVGAPEADGDIAATPETHDASDVSAPAPVLPREAAAWFMEAPVLIVATVAELGKTTEAPADFVPGSGEFDVTKTVIADVSAAVLLETASLDPVGTGRVSVFLPKGIDVTVGERVVFVVNWWVLGQSILFRDVGHVPACASDEAVTAAGLEVRAFYHDVLLRRLVASSAIVVAGEVKALGDETEPLVDNLPIYKSATVEVSDVIANAANISTAEPLVVFWDKAMSHCCYENPKLEVGKKGVFLVARGPLDGTSWLHIAEPGRLQPLDERPRIEGLLVDPTSPLADSPPAWASCPR